MKFRFKWICLLLFSTIIVWQILNFLNTQRFRLDPTSKTVPIVAVVACGDRLQEALNMLKSALIFTRHTKEMIRFVIVAEHQLMDGFREKLESWRKEYHLLFEYEIHPLSFPEKNNKEWKKLFKPCSAQRLFLPDILNHIDSLVYMDSDTIFLSPVHEVWSLFNSFNASQIAGLTPESEDKNTGWYNRFSRHPFYPPFGVNSGIILMNLTRMREFDWTSRLLPIYEEYKLKLVWGDQDIINILFNFHPEKLHVIPCEWNYRPDHCMYMSVCPAPNGIKILHGNRGYFHSLAQPIFNYIYTAVEEYQFDMEPTSIINAIESNLAIPERNSNCDKLSEKFFHNMKIIFNVNNDKNRLPSDSTFY